MSIAECKGCGGAVLTEADACPRCNYSTRRAIAKILLGVAIIGFSAMLLFVVSPHIPHSVL
jgi:hypothetical protein